MLLKPDLHNNGNQIKDTIIIILGFWIIYYMCYLLEVPLHTFLSRYITVRSEYTVGEQLSKLYLFIIVLISVFSYQVFNKPTKIKLSISFLLLSLILYMSESNMITEETQPIFGLIIVACTGILLLRLRFWLSLFFFIVGFLAISGGSLSDFAHENESIRSLFPTFVFPLLQITSEERFDVIGIAFLCLSAIFCFRVPFLNFIAKNKKGTLLILLSSGMITIGNGFLHSQYNPGRKLQLFALVMTIIGFLGLMFANKSISTKDTILTLVTKNLFYIFIFFFFVLLPSIHGRARNSTALLLWFPIMFLMAVYLWRYHPTYHTSTDRIGNSKRSKKGYMC